MRKDYILVQTQERGLEEIALIEQFWTARWGDARLNCVGNGCRYLAHRDEYCAMKPYLDRLPAGARLLDAGCGMGDWTVFLAEQGFNVVGLDISQAVIAALRSQFPRLAFERGDIRRMDFPAGHFDACFSWGVCEHFEEGLQPCIAETWRVLKPGGYLFVSVPFHNLRHILHGLRRWEAWDADLASGLKDANYLSRPPVRFYQWRLTRAELARELVIGGFDVLVTAPIHRVHGLERTLVGDLRLRPGTLSYRLAMRALRILAPASLVAHMVMAVAQKPGYSE